MMEEFQELWQHANIDERGMDQLYQTKDFVPQIIKLEKNQEKLILFKTTASIVLIVALLVLFLNRMEITATGLAGIGIFAGSFLYVLILLNRLRFQITHEERSLPTLELVAVAEKKIHMERRVFTTYLPVFALVALAGFNLMYLEMFRELEMGARLLNHSLMTGSVLIAFVAGLSIRIHRFRKQFQPILDRIGHFRENSVNDST